MAADTELYQANPYIPDYSSGSFWDISAGYPQPTTSQAEQQAQPQQEQPNAYEQTMFQPLEAYPSVDWSSVLNSINQNYQQSMDRISNLYTQLAATPATVPDIPVDLQAPDATQNLAQSIWQPFGWDNVPAATAAAQQAQPEAPPGPYGSFEDYTIDPSWSRYSGRLQSIFDAAPWEHFVDPYTATAPTGREYEVNPIESYRYALNRFTNRLAQPTDLSSGQMGSYILGDIDYLNRLARGYSQPGYEYQDISTSPIYDHSYRDFIRAFMQTPGYQWTQDVKNLGPYRAMRQWGQQNPGSTNWAQDSGSTSWTQSNYPRTPALTPGVAPFAPTGKQLEQLQGLL